jgi:hypothetical protein
MQNFLRQLLASPAAKVKKPHFRPAARRRKINWDCIYYHRKIF